MALSDTVGFIRDLPHTLIEAFQATLQEAADADLLLHVVDGASPELAEQIAEVERVLGEIGAGDVAQVIVFNKLDRLVDTERPRALADSFELPGGRRVPRVFASARSGEGLDALRARIAEAIAGAAGDPGDLNADATAADEDIAVEPLESGEGDGEDLRDGTYHSLA